MSSPAELHSEPRMWQKSVSSFPFSFHAEHRTAELSESGPPVAALPEPVEAPPDAVQHLSYTCFIAAFCEAVLFTSEDCKSNLSFHVVPPLFGALRIDQPHTPTLYLPAGLPPSS